MSKRPKKSKETAIVKFGEKELRAEVKVGMSKVDPLDIRPPQILLIQKSSNLQDFEDQAGQHPMAGQFFHNGMLKILDDFECYFLFAAKTGYTDRRKPEEGEKPQYRAIGVMADSLSVFGMTFRSSALYALSPLFTATVGMKRPMYSLKVRIETKALENDQGKWWIPVVKVLPDEKDFEKFSKLSELAKQYDLRADELAHDKEEEEGEIDPDDIPL